MKPIIEIGRGDAIFDAAAEQIAAAHGDQMVDFRLQFDSAAAKGCPSTAAGCCSAFRHLSDVRGAHGLEP